MGIRKQIDLMEIAMAITAEQLRQIMPNAGARADAYAAALNDAMDEFEINTPARQAMFLANIAHESGSLASVSENLNYKAEALAAVFNTATKKRFTPEMAQQYGRSTAHPADQEMIANIAYANRMGNGDVESGDGWRYRGGGLIQTTGADNQRAVAEHFGVAFEEIDTWLRSPEGASRSAGFFWDSNNLNALADAGDFTGVCGVINVGKKSATPAQIKGYADRVEFLNRGQQALA
jgi:putative chitinase